MTRKEAIKRIKEHMVIHKMNEPRAIHISEALNMAIKALECEPLTDTEQRIFLDAMSREEKDCKKVCADGERVDFAVVCRRIERKVKRALWG